MSKPIVAIVGRPNVGKSTLFNRLVGERIAIIEDLPGTTRDRIFEDITWGEREITLVDTGGLELSPDSDLRQMVKAQVETAIEETDVLLLVVDVRDGVTNPDVEVAQTLRRARKPVVLVANKADNEQRRYEALQFHQLALGDPIAVSAYHGTGLSDLMDAVAARLPPSTPSPEEPVMMKLAIVGRPNVGKSTLLNAILGQERAIVAETPGTTRDAIDTVCQYNGESILLIDTAGIRRRGHIEGGIERYSVLRALRAIARADVALLLTETPEVITAQDTHIAGYIQQAFKGVVLVVNKWDRAAETGKDAAECTREIRQKLKFMPHVSIQFISAKLGQGIDRVISSAKEVYGERLKRLPTSSVNRVVSEAATAHAPPTVRGKRLNILYATQTEVNPPTFVFFVNDPQLVHFSYQRYLENRLRDAFGFAGNPLRLIFKRRTSK